MDYPAYPKITMNNLPRERTMAPGRESVTRRICRLTLSKSTNYRDCEKRL